MFNVLRTLYYIKCAVQNHFVSVFKLITLQLRYHFELKPAMSIKIHQICKHENFDKESNRLNMLFYMYLTIYFKKAISKIVNTIH